MKYVYLFSLLLFSTYIKAQNIEGVWQINSYIVGSTLDQYYQFNNDENFRFHPSGFDGLNRILSIGGKYQIEKDSIYFLVEFIEECIGGTIERSTITTHNNSWAINNDDCKIVKTFFDVKKKWSVPFKFNVNQEGHKIIVIGDNIYFWVKEEEYPL